MTNSNFLLNLPLYTLTPCLSTLSFIFTTAFTYMQIFSCVYYTKHPPLQSFQVLKYNTERLLKFLFTGNFSACNFSKMLLQKLSNTSVYYEQVISNIRGGKQSLFMKDLCICSTNKCWIKTTVQVTDFSVQSCIE